MERGAVALFGPAIYLCQRLGRSLFSYSLPLFSLKRFLADRMMPRMIGQFLSEGSMQIVLSFRLLNLPCIWLAGTPADPEKDNVPISGTSATATPSHIPSFRCRHRNMEKWAVEFFGVS